MVMLLTGQIVTVFLSQNRDNVLIKIKIVCKNKIKNKARRNFSTLVNLCHKTEHCCTVALLHCCTVALPHYRRNDAI